MKYKRLQDLRNTYPATTTDELNNVQRYYAKENGYVRRFGRDTEVAFLDYKTYPIDKLQTLDPSVYPNVDFSFIIQFIDESEGFMEEWTSYPFKKLLLQAQEDGNPYFNKYTVPIIPIDYGTLKDHHRKNKLAIGEAYSEVTVTKTIASIEEMILHIHWLTVFTEELRNTEVGNRINDAKYPIDGIGSWVSTHDKTGDFGFGWEDLLKQTLTDKVFAEEIISERVKPKDISVTTPTNKSIPILPKPTDTPILSPIIDTPVPPQIQNDIKFDDMRIPPYYPYEYNGGYYNDPRPYEYNSIQMRGGAYYYL